MADSVKKTRQKKIQGRPVKLLTQAKIGKYNIACNHVTNNIFKTTAEIFLMLEHLENNKMNLSKTSRDLNISLATVRSYKARYWHEYEAKKKIDIEEAERRARATIVSYDNPEELTVEVVDKQVEKVRTIINDSFLLSMDEIKRRLLDPVERQKLGSRDIIAHIANLLPYLTFKIGELTQQPNALQNKDEFFNNFIETMTGYKQKSMNQ